jgi:MinD-like ATPase involved in chromosome partitioning or flagellar assembly
MLRVATVLSAREWEARLVAAARDSAALRLVLRAYLPDEVTSRAGEIDVVVAGSETPWVTPTRIAAWRRLGLQFVGVLPRADRPAAERFVAGGADLVIEEDLDPDQVVREIRLLDPSPRKTEANRSDVIVVTGPRGGPGRTEIAAAIAWAAAGRGEAALVDADLAGPSVAIRLGLPPRPDLADCVDAVLDRTPTPDLLTQTVGRLRVVPGAHRPTGIRPEAAGDVVDTLALAGRVVVDVGPWPDSSSMIRSTDQVVFVVEATPIGIVRAARIVDEWDGPPPNIVLNKVHPLRVDDAVVAVRRWSGLEPMAAILFRRGIRTAAASGGPPHRSILKAVDPLLESMLDD